MFSEEKKTKECIIENIICDKYNSYYRMAYSYVHNEVDAADIVQEGAYKAMKNSNTLKRIDYASTWIYRIMINEIYRFLESRMWDSMDDDAFHQPETYDQYQNIDLYRALNRLDVKDKAVVQLKYFEDMKLEEIADVLDENINTVKSRLYRALKKIRTSMESED